MHGPELIAERLLRFANLVGRECVMAGADCGFSSQAMYKPKSIPASSGKIQGDASRCRYRDEEALEQAVPRM